MDGLGEALRTEREKKSIPLDTIADKTNISLKSLIALENEEIKQIPGAFYFRNYIKAYLGAIGTEPDEFFETHKDVIDAAYEKAFGDSDEYCSKLKYSRFKKKNFFLSFLLTGIVFILVFYIIYSHRDNIFRGWDHSPVHVPIPESTLDWTALEAHRDYSRDFSPLHVSIEFSDRCWTQVLRSGEKLIERTYEKGENLSVNGYELTVVLANPGVVRFLINGKEVSYLRKSVNPEKLVITPAAIDGILKK